MEQEMVAKCGLVCTECEAYIATQTNDIDALTVMAEKASQQFGMQLTWEDNICNGCLSDLKQVAYCQECGVRRCATVRGYENCAYCPDFGCEIAAGFWEHAPKAKSKLEAIRASL